MIAVLVLSLSACGKDDTIATVQGLHGVHSSVYYDVDIDFGEKTLEQVVSDAVEEDVKVSWKLEPGEIDDSVILSLTTDESFIELCFMSDPIEGRANWAYATANETLLDGVGMEELAQMLFGSYLLIRYHRY